MEALQARKSALLLALARVDDAQPWLPLDLGELFAAKVKELRDSQHHTVPSTWRPMFAVWHRNKWLPRAQHPSPDSDVDNFVA